MPSVPGRVELQVDLYRDEAYVHSTHYAFDSDSETVWSSTTEQIKSENGSVDSTRCYAGEVPESHTAPLVFNLLQIFTGVTRMLKVSRRPR